MHTANKDEIKSLMRKLLDTVIENDPANKRYIHYWEWNQGVGLFGIIKAHMATGDSAYTDFLADWFKQNDHQRRFGSVNCVIHSCAALYMYSLTGDEFYKEICDVYADWTLNKVLRTTNGGIAHVWSVGGLEDYKNQLWADSVFMAGMFMVFYGKASGNKELLAEGVKQFEIHAKSLYDPDAKLFSHGYHCLRNERLGAHWGRGNGWVVAALSELFGVLDKEEYPRDLREIYETVMETAYSAQTESGMLRTLIDLDDTYEEATAAMLFGYAAFKGCELGILDERYKKWAEKILERLKFFDNGSAMECSGGTDCQAAEGYYDIPFVQSSYADGIQFMFLSCFVKGE